MNHTVLIPFPLRPYTGGAAEVVAAGATAGELLASLAEAYPGIGRHLSPSAGGFRSTLHLFVNGREVSGPDQELGSVETVEVVPSIAGGGHEVCERYHWPDRRADADTRD